MSSLVLLLLVFIFSDFFQLEISERDYKENMKSLRNAVEAKSFELKEASETIEELKLFLSKEKSNLEKG